MRLSRKSVVTFLSNWKSSARAVKIADLVLMSDMAESGLRPVAEMAALDTGVRWLELRWGIHNMCAACFCNL